MSIGEEYFEEWADFILKNIQHPSSKIRQAIITAADYLIMDIRIDFRETFDKSLPEEEQRRIQNNLERFGRFVFAVENLLDKYDELRFNSYKYISSMPSSVYKSLQKLLVEVLLRTDYYEEIYESFLKSGGLIRATPGETEIVSKVEEKLQKLIDKYKLNKKLTIETIKGWVWCKNGDTTMNAVNAFHKKVFDYFGNVQDMAELNEILSTLMDAWNYFPHQSLGGKSPDLMVKSELEKNPNLSKKRTNKIPDFNKIFMLWAPNVPSGLAKLLNEYRDNIVREGRTFDLLINQKYTACVDELAKLAKKDSKNTGEPFYRVLQILGHLKRD